MFYIIILIPHTIKLHILCFVVLCTYGLSSYYIGAMDDGPTIY